ncbi:glycosyltransferase family 4 protein [Geobacter anodireducens]
MLENNSMVRVAMVTCTMHPGGLETYLLRLGGYLKSKGYQVDIITTADKGPWFGLIRERGIGSKHFQQPRKRWRRLHAIKVAVKLALARYDVIFTNHASPAQYSVSLLPDRVVVIPVVHNHHDEVYRVAGLNAGACNVAVTVSPKLYETFRQKYPHSKALCIPHGIDVPPAEILSGRLPHTFPLELIFVGQLAHDHKGVLFLPDIVKGCLAHGADVRLTVIGGGPDRERLESKIRELQLEKYIVLKGVIQPDEIYHYFTRSHIHLMPSFFEGLGLVLLESQANGCVPVASHLPGVTDTALVDGVSGFLVKTGAVEEFVHAILLLYNDPHKWTAMSHAAATYVRRHRSIDKMGEKYVALIQECLAGEYPLAKSRKRQMMSLFGRVPAAL